MKKLVRTFLVIGILLCTSQIFAQTGQKAKALQTLQQRGEVYFSFSLLHQPSIPLLKQINKSIYIDNRHGDTVFAYANKRGFEQFLKLNIKFRTLTPPSMRLPRVVLDSRPLRNTNDWNYYPTYSQYVDLMNGFVSDHPDLCELVNIGQTVNGHSLLFIHINDSLGIDRNEPEFMYTATMHGDETTPYVLMLHLIDYLLSNYGSDAKVTNLINNIDIWINPLANPDGTYAGGDNTVYGARRTNGNYVDLNRNYPDPADGPHPDGNAYQPETQDFMNLADAHDFVMSCNMHTGSELANYPWDTWAKRSADDAWWIYVCRQYADTVHAYSPAGYFTDENNGITDGYDWYRITGGRQDYMNYFQNCREFTLELSHVKTPPPAQLPGFWNDNYHSFLNYMQQALYGVRGIVTSKQSGMAVKAKVFVENHDEDNSWVYASLPIGNYHRPIKMGNYSFTFSALGYYSQTFTNVSPIDESTLFLNVQLHPVGVMVADFHASDTLVSLNDSIDFFDNSYADSIVAWQWSFQGATPDTSSLQNPTGILYNQTGDYDVSLTVTDTSGATKTTSKTAYIHVMEPLTMQNGTFTTCSALFYDTGGPDQNYGNNEKITMTLAPASNHSVIKVHFTRFELESSTGCVNDYLSVFDGSDTTAPLIGTYCGNEIPPVFVAHNNGMLTFRFHSNNSNNLSGWEALVSCDTNVGLTEIKPETLELYPNPTSGKVFLKANQPLKKITVFDVNGQCVHSETVAGKEVGISLHALPNGLYFIIVNTEHNLFSKKVVLEKRKR